jgi:ubiquitin C-terminal hydrolase
LDFDADESPIFLSLDWRNDERSANHCSVTVKSPTDYEDLSQENSDPSADGDISPNQRRLTLHHCLQQFMQSEVLSKEEAWYCPK